MKALGEATLIQAPHIRPADPRFSCGPCRKRPGWSFEALEGALLGRAHRAKDAKERLKQAIELTRAVLEIPADYRIGIVPGSDTGAIEMALWSMLGARGVDVLSWEAFGERWSHDITHELKLSDVRVFHAPYGEMVDLAAIDFSRDVIFTWNGTASGVAVQNGDWIAADRQGLTICDATSAAFAQKLDWAKLDVTTLSWQKGLGSEAAHGMIVLAPRAVERLETYEPAWPLPKLFRMVENGKLMEGIFEGETINTPSLLCVEDYIDALYWAQSVGGLDVLVAKTNANAKVMTAWVEKTPWIEFLAKDPAYRTTSSLCFSLIDPAITSLSKEAQAAFIKDLMGFLADEGVAVDIGSYRDAPAGLRVWCGPTVEAADLEALTLWLDYAYARVSESAKVAA